MCNYSLTRNGSIHLKIFLEPVQLFKKLFYFTLIRILPSLLWKYVDDKHDITASKVFSEMVVEKMSSQSMDHHQSNLKVFSSSLRTRRSDSREECAIYHTTNRDTTFCRDQIVSCPHTNTLVSGEPDMS